MEIRYIFESSVRRSLAKQIFKIIKDDKDLTNRSLGFIQKRTELQSVFVAYERDRLIGFVIKDNLFDSVYEIKSWYVSAEKRGRGVGRSLLHKAISGRNERYLMTTFYKNAATTARKEGFEEVPYLGLPFNVLVKVILSRNPKSILKHSFFKRSKVLVKNL